MPLDEGRRLKILFLGPATAHLSNWLNSFVACNVDVTLVTLHRGSHFVHDFPCIDLSAQVRTKASYLLALPAVKSILQRERPDLLVSYYASSYGLLGRLTGFSPRVVVTA